MRYRVIQLSRTIRGYIVLYRVIYGYILQKTALSKVKALSTFRGTGLLQVGFSTKPAFVRMFHPLWSLAAPRKNWSPSSLDMPDGGGMSLLLLVEALDPCL